MNPKVKSITSRKLVQILEEKSKKGIDLAKRMMLEEKIKSDIIRHALEYYVSNWEILTHPAPFAIAYEAVGGDPDKMAEAQAAVVMLSAALDIHDDIIDKSETKHGKQTLTGKYGQDIALLLGNAFFVNGFMLLDHSASKLRPEKVQEIFHITKKGLFEVGDAHALEFRFRQEMHANAEEYMQILKMKAVTTQMSMQLGAMLGGGTNEEMEALTRYGRILGTLAALREEFIDIFETRELNQRLQNECLPLPILYALEDSNSKKIEEILSKKKIRKDNGEDLLRLISQSRRVKALKKEMMVMIEDAHNLTYEIENATSRSLLDALVASMVENL
jgi:geranylgeranyl pyrophosphate synthase